MFSVFFPDEFRHFVVDEGQHPMIAVGGRP